MFSPKAPAEVVTLTFDFAALTATPANAAIAVSDTTGADAAAINVLQGAPQITGTKVLQQVKGGLPGSLYLFVCQVDANDGTSQHWQVKETLPVE